MTINELLELTDVQLQAALQGALERATADEIAAAARVAKLSRAIAALGDAPAEPDAWVEAATKVVAREAKPPRVADRQRVAKMPSTTPTKRAPRAQTATCQYCSKPCAPQGLANHERTCTAKPKPLAPLASVPDAHDEPPRPPTAQVDGMGFECSSCRATFPTTRELTHHTITEHDRPPRPGERVAIPA